jgi:hypothetical protein
VLKCGGEDAGHRETGSKSSSLKAGEKRERGSEKCIEKSVPCDQRLSDDRLKVDFRTLF